MEITLLFFVLATFYTWMVAKGIKSGIIHIYALVVMITFAGLMV